MNSTVVIVFVKLFFASFMVAIFTASHAEDTVTAWVKPTPIFKQDYDWVKLTSDEWLKGDIISMYDQKLEFDSDELDTQIIDLDDVAELRSKNWQSISMYDGTIAEGY
jgi:hypothetical protein